MYMISGSVRPTVFNTKKEAIDALATMYNFMIQSDNIANSELYDVYFRINYNDCTFIEAEVSERIELRNMYEGATMR